MPDWTRYSYYNIELGSTPVNSVPQTSPQTVKRLVRALGQPRASGARPANHIIYPFYRLITFVFPLFF